MLYLDNPGKGKGKRMAKRKTKTKRKARKGPSAKQIAARRKFARMAKARAKASRSKAKRATTVKGVGMAKRKRTTTKRRRSSKRRSVVRSARRSVYRANPRRSVKRRRRGGYRRNPGMVRELFTLVKRSGTVLGGGIVGRVVTDMLPAVAPQGKAESPVVTAAKGTLVAIGVRMLAKRFLGADVATDLAIGAMQVPLKTLIVGFAPAENRDKVASFLGDYSLGAYAGDLVAQLPDGTEVREFGNPAGVSSYAEMYE